MKLDFFEMVQEVQNLGVLSDSQRKGAIRLVFKKEDRSDLKFYRPISLVNVDVKIITKTPDWAKFYPLSSVKTRQVYQGEILQQTCTL